MADALELTCPHCEGTAVYHLASSRRILPCKNCRKQMSLPSREEVVRAAALLRQLSMPSGGPLLASNPNGPISSQFPLNAPSAAQIDTSSTQAAQANWPLIDSIAAQSFPDLRVAPRVRRRQKRSPAVFLISVILGGIAGLIAGYLVLCRIDRGYDFLHLTSEENDNDQSHKISEKPIKLITPLALVP